MALNDGQPRVVRDPARFVTAVAWSFIVLAAALGSLMVLQAVFVWAVLPWDAMEELVRQGEEAREATGRVRSMLAHLPWMIAVLIGLSAIWLAAAVGLLKRRQWARMLFVVLLAVAILYCVGCALLETRLGARLLGEGGRGTIQGSSAVSRGIVTVVAAGVSVVFAWIIRRLLSDDVRREFARHRRLR